MNQLNTFLLLVVLMMLLGLYSIKWVLTDYDKITRAIESGKEDPKNDWGWWDIGWQASIFVCGFIIRGLI